MVACVVILYGQALTEGGQLLLLLVLTNCVLEFVTLWFVFWEFMFLLHAGWFVLVGEEMDRAFKAAFRPAAAPHAFSSVNTSVKNLKHHTNVSSNL